MDTLKKLDGVIYRIESVIAGIALCVIIVLTSGNVFARLVLRKSFVWSEEVSYICFTWLVFFGAAILYAKRGLITIDIIVDRLGRTARRVVEIITDVLLFIANICLVCWSVQVMLTTTRITSILRVPYNVVYFGMALAFLFMSYDSAKFFILSVTGRQIQEAAIEDRA